MATFQTLADLAARVGQDVASSDWVTVTQPQINAFADATGDRQWIHVDPERAKAGPFGGTIAHGFLTLSLLPSLMSQAVVLTEPRMAVNYGLDRVRFPAPVPAGSRVRAHFKLLATEPAGTQGLQLTWEATFEREGHAKPVCVAESLIRYY
ncbi:MAG: putative enoyl-CoA hydratase 1 [Paracidovorax wautersii]|uniref:Putative enoyl-CoA hydratase 1 n=1 Tax=Paracidovorax wautersii TaxID=1177982 RepID=A0A7V8FPU1_9BURK|nr:MAG: putative enoyl-CoA hydratase 1 [Paracidovorax wautersii]